MLVTVWHRQGLFDRTAGSWYLHTDAGDLFRRGYRPGERIKRVYDYDVDAGEKGVSLDSVREIAEQAFRIFNDAPASDWERDHARRYRAAGHRSLSVGDVVIVGEIALSCEPVGWVPVTVPSIDPTGEEPQR